MPLLNQRQIVQNAYVVNDVFKSAERTGNLAWALDEMADSSLRRSAYRVRGFVSVAFPIVLIAFADLGVRAEPQVWTLADETTFEAELVSVYPTEIIFKNAQGEILKIPLERLSPESRTQIELENPPTLSIGLIKDRNAKVFPSGITMKTTRPPEVRCHYGVRIRQTSRGDYSQKLHMELFVIGIERLGDKYILLDRQNASFFLTKENNKEFEFRSEREVVLQNFYVDLVVRGEKYHGYLAIVKDVRGEIIAVDTSHNWLFENLDNLSERYANNFMDETCVRVFPTRASVFMP